MYRLLLLFSLVFIFCASQTRIQNPEQLNYQQVYEVTLTKDVIYDKALEWMARTYGSSKEVIELQDKELGKIIGKGITQIKYPLATIPCEYTIIVEAKDNKFRVTFETFIVTYLSGERRLIMYEQNWTQIQPELQKIAQSLYTFISTEKEESW